MSRIIHCSRCRQEGHNRRNRNCPLNPAQRPTRPPSTPPGPPPPLTPPGSPPPFTRASTPPGPPPVMQPRAPRDTTPGMRTLNLLSSAMRVFEVLEHFIPRQDEFSRNDYALSVVAMSITFCEQMNLALDSDSVETPLITPIPIFEHFAVQIGIFNAIMNRRAILFHLSLVVSFQNNRFRSVVTIPTNSNASVIKRTSAYFKEITLVQDLTITEDAPKCACPLCFDDFAATDVVVTNCNHSFCGDCVKGFSTSIKDKTKIPNCPMCRTNLTEFKVGSQQVYEDIQNHILNL